VVAISSLIKLSAVDLDRHGPVHLGPNEHHGAKCARFHGQALGAQLVDHFQIETLRVLGVCRFIERRAPSATDVTEQRELRNDQDCAFDVLHGKRHAAIVVREHAQPRDLVRNVFHVLGLIVARRTEIDQQPAANRPDGLAVDRDTRSQNSLHDGAHARGGSTTQIVLPRRVDVQYSPAMKRVVGLTGGIACGKTTVAQMFDDLGIPIVDADDLAREVVEPGTPGLQRVVEKFGKGVLDNEGRLDRKKVGDMVFNDEEARDALNAILHPLIGAAGAKRLEALQQHPAPYLMYEAALLVETGSYKAFSALVVVSADESLQRLRLIARDGYTVAEANARIASQLPLARKIAVADYVVTNNGDLEATRQQVGEVHAKLVSRFASKESH